MTLALVDERMPEEAVSSLSAEGFAVLPIPRHKALTEPICSHPDMLLFRIGRRLVVSEEYYRSAERVFEKLVSLLPDIEIVKSAVRLSADYPHDCAFNALVMGRRLFVKADTAAPELIEAARAKGLDIIGVRQGYPACTALALGGSYAITADLGMKRVLSQNGVEVLGIENGDILLPPYDHGFIGGAAGVYGGRAYFIGELESHRCGEAIRGFCIKAGYEPVNLCRGRLWDLGRIIFIPENLEDNN